MEKEIEIKNPKRRVVEDLKIRNKGNGKSIAGEYFGSKFNYDKTFKMFEDYKKAFLHLDGKNGGPITISALSAIAGVNAFYGAIDANKIANMIGPGFLYEYSNRYTRDINSKTVFIFDKFLNEEFISRLHKAEVKNMIITSITDYMHPLVKFVGKRKGLLDDKDFLDEYVKSGKRLPMDMQFIRLKEFAKTGSKIKENIEFPYEENQIACNFLTGATTSKLPKSVQLYGDGLTKMLQIYDELNYGFKPGDRNGIFIPLWYATGAIHGSHAGLAHGVTNVYEVKYDKYAFGKVLKDSKINIAGAAPGHVATLANSGLKKDDLKHVKYIFIGGEAILPPQMKKFRETTRELGIKHILNGYGMTEMGSMCGISSLNPKCDDDVTIIPLPGVKFRVVDPKTRKVLPDNEQGILEVKTPCATAGYLDEEKNKHLFTSDGWINTDDVADHKSNKRHQVYGRYDDYFINNDKKYALFEIEQNILKHPGVSEAEVIKFKIKDNEYPAMVVVITEEWKDNKEDLLKYIEQMDASGIEYLLGTRFINNFEISSTTHKRDVFSLYENKTDYFKFNSEYNKTYQINFEEEDEIKVTVASKLELQEEKEKVNGLILKR